MVALSKAHKLKTLKYAPRAAITASVVAKF